MASPSVIAFTTISLLISNSPGNQRDFVALYKHGAPDTQYVTWKYVACNGQSCPAKRATSGMVTFVTPDVPGDYEARLLSVNSTGGYNLVTTLYPLVRNYKQVCVPAYDAVCNESR